MESTPDWHVEIAPIEESTGNTSPQARVFDVNYFLESKS